VADSIKAQHDEAEHVIRAQMARIAELEAELERLRSAAGAHDVLREIYANANQPTGHRIKAAGIAIGHEVPKIQSVPPPLELSAEEAVPLAQLVEQRRARQNELCPQSADLPPIEVLPLADGRSRNASGNDAHYWDTSKRPSREPDHPSRATWDSRRG
jgi:hypothetical protein